MVRTKFHQNQPSRSWKEDFLGFTIYEHDRHLAHVTSILLMNFRFTVPTSLHSKIALNLSRSLLKKSKFYGHM